jgi:ribosomal protein S18 acetylase RimI-like enzyme
MLEPMPPDLKLRSARASEAPRLADMSRRWIERGLGWRWRPARLAACMRDGDTEVLVAADGAALIGFAVMQFRFAEREADLLLLAVDPTRRRCGVARALVTWLEQVARLGGIESIALEVRANDVGARAFYRALGFRERARVRGYYQGREDALRLVRRLLR